MSFREIDAHCLSLPGARKVVQWGDTNVYKIGRKMFAAIGAGKETVVLKCADGDMARMLVETGAARWMPYFGQKQWVGIAIGTDAVMPVGEIMARATASCRLVRASLTRKEQAALPAMIE